MKKDIFVTSQKMWSNKTKMWSNREKKRKNVE